MQENVFETNFETSGKSRKTDANGMIEMQSRAFEKRLEQYLLIKSPPASGKSRALMFLGLDKLHHQGIKKVIVAVPEISIGSSFKPTALKEHGFFADWDIVPQYNLCISGGDKSKVKAFIKFIKSDDDDAKVLICTHATLRFAYQELDPSDFDDVLLGVDEFHHTSAASDNKLGELLDGVIDGSTAHIVAMTGSYFRGDAVPILTPEHENLFAQVTYSYYEQLNGYEYLKSLGINYHFYQNGYLSALSEVLDTSKKTIIHIPSVNSFESTKDKYSELDHIIDAIGEPLYKDDVTGILTVKDKKGRLLKVADLVTDDKGRAAIQNHLAGIVDRDELDIIIALGMAKEGFDWVWCEHVLTIGYRASLTEIIQIIGRATRDAAGKTHAQFTNLVAEPEAARDDINRSVNNLLKAITVSLLMQQVLAPNINFKPRSAKSKATSGDSDNTIYIDDETTPLSKRAQQILENSDTIKAELLQNPKDIIGPMMTGQADVQTLLEVFIPNVILEKYPGLDEDEAVALARIIHSQMVLQANGGIIDEDQLPADAEFWDVGETSSTKNAADKPDMPLENGAFIFDTPENLGMTGDADNLSDKSSDNHSDSLDSSSPKPQITINDNSQTSAMNEDEKTSDNNNPDDLGDKASRKFVMIDNKFVNVEDLKIDLIQEAIESTNPFEASYKVLSKSVTPETLKSIEGFVANKRSNMTEEEAVILWPKIQEFASEHGHLPEYNSLDGYEQRLAMALELIKEIKRRKEAQLAANEGE